MTMTDALPAADQLHVLDHGFVRLDGAMGDDLSVVNAARVSFGRRSEAIEDRDAGLIRFLMRERHGSPFEHNAFRFHVKCPIFVAREWFRHRVGCLAGDAEVTFVNTNGMAAQNIRKPMSELWRMWDEGERNGHAVSDEAIAQAHRLLRAGASLRAASRATGVARNTLIHRFRTERPPSLRDARWRVRGMRLRVLDESTNEFTVGHVAEVFDAGIQPAFRVTLADGKQLTMTERHEVLTEAGWRTLRDAVGLVGEGADARATRSCRLLVNGRPVHQDRDWMASQRRSGASVTEIATAAGCSYHTVRKWLRVHGLQFDASERNFPPGHRPWNAGRPGYTLRYSPSESHRAAVARARAGARSNFWRGGVTSDRANIARWTTEQAARVHLQHDYTCQQCGVRGGRLHAHHIVPVWADSTLARDVSNLISVCDGCHRAIHRTRDSELSFMQRFVDRIGTVDELPQLASRKGWKLTAHPVEIVSVEHVGAQQTYDLSVDGPHHNFVANGMVVHNSFNERSARYSEMPDEFYVPAAEDVRTQVGKPGSYRFEAVGDELAESARDTLEHAYREAYEAYRQLLADGVAKEVARSVLPVGLYTEFYWTVNARSLMNFVSLRNSETAQLEIRRYAQAVEELWSQHMPRTHAAFVENARTAP